MNTDKAYILGLTIGGGCFNSDHTSFHIRLPYRQWGEIEKNPQRAGVIANDILHVVKPLMRVEYDLDVSYETGREWKILCSGDLSKLIDDLGRLSIEPTAELHKTADISQLVTGKLNPVLSHVESAVLFRFSLFYQRFCGIHKIA